ncbi:MAG: hypothetical protein L3K16_01135 [Thermoplasmata archaeon]|nr:hypothetical protein [Thermoplasmata archaeon]
MVGNPPSPTPWRYLTTLAASLALTLLAQFLVWEPWFGVPWLLVLALTGIGVVLLGGTVVLLYRDDEVRARTRSIFGGG